MLNIPQNCDIYDTEFSPHKWFINFIKDDVHKNLLSNWPNQTLIKDEGNEKPRKHGQRNHIRKFMCYANYTPGKMLQKFMIEKTKNFYLVIIILLKQKNFTQLPKLLKKVQLA